MRKILFLVSIAVACSTLAQTVVNITAFPYNGGIYPTFSVVFDKTQAGAVEKWYKEQLDRVSADMGGKKEVMSIGTRIPAVSSDTIRVFVKAEQPKKDMPVTLHAAFRVNGTFIGPDSEPRQVEGCRNWMYEHAVMLKKELGQRELDAANKLEQQLESELAGLVKEKDRAQNSIEKTQNNITEDGQEKVATEGLLTSMSTSVDAKKQEVHSSPSEENTKALQSLLKDQEKLERKREKLTKDIESGKKKIEDLQSQIKQNLEDQETKRQAIEAQKKVVADLTTKLANIN